MNEQQTMAFAAVVGVIGVMLTAVSVLMLVNALAAGALFSSVLWLATLAVGAFLAAVGGGSVWLLATHETYESIEQHPR